jgi:hypothetical protein
MAQSNNVDPSALGFLTPDPAERFARAFNQFDRQYPDFGLRQILNDLLPVILYHAAIFRKEAEAKSQEEELAKAKRLDAEQDKKAVQSVWGGGMRQRTCSACLQAKGGMQRARPG